jgi:hypothetical protein
MFDNYYYGGPVCRNEFLDDSHTCSGHASCGTPQKGGGMLGAERNTKIGRGCQIVHTRHEGTVTAKTACVANVDAKQGDVCYRGLNETTSEMCPPHTACGFANLDDYNANKTTCCPSASVKFLRVGTSGDAYDHSNYFCSDIPLHGKCYSDEQCAGGPSHGVGCVNGTCQPSCNVGYFKRTWPDCDTNDKDPDTTMGAIPECGTANAAKTYCCFAARQKANAAQNCPAGYTNTDFCTQEYKTLEKDWVHRKCVKNA